MDDVWVEVDSDEVVYADLDVYEGSVRAPLLITFPNLNKKQLMRF